MLCRKDVHSMWTSFVLMAEKNAQYTSSKKLSKQRCVMVLKRRLRKPTYDMRMETDYSRYKLEQSLQNNIAVFRSIFSDDDTFIVREFENQNDTSIKCCIFYIDGMVNAEIINENIIQPVIQNAIAKDSEDILNDLKNHVIAANNVQITADIASLSDAIIRGDSVFVLDGAASGLIINSRGWQTRPIDEPPSERVIQGPKEGFVESIAVNLSLIRRKLGTPDLKIRYKKLGVQSQTKICVCYLDGIVNEKILEEVYRRLDTIDTDSIIDSGYIREFIRDEPFSPFQTIDASERPDVIAADLLSGRVAIIADGSPTVLIMPYTYIKGFQANEDYYINFGLATANRILRMMGFWTSISAPAVYVALVTYHQEAIPTPLLLSISAARQGVPFPTIVEILLLTIVFEMLRDAGVRMPSNLGQTLSIVGALVLGSASVEAKIVSAPIVIVVSVTAITSLMIPKLTPAILPMRIILLLLSSFLGLYGYILGIMGMLIHLSSMYSFGVPYMSEFITLDPAELKDTAIRAPVWHMKTRPRFVTFNRIRVQNGGRKK